MRDGNPGFVEGPQVALIFKDGVFIREMLMVARWPSLLIVLGAPPSSTNVVAAPRPSTGNA